MVQILPRSWILRFTGLGKVRETSNRVATVDSVADAGSWRFQFLARTAQTGMRLGSGHRLAV
jgi:hypothetical protein